MQLWAAIDLLEGSVVTLVQGKASQRTVWKEEPLRVARRWQREGAHGLHLIDLDAAFQKGSNRETMMEIIRSADVPVEVGGGMRTPQVVSQWLEAGADRVVVGTLAYKEPAALSELLLRHGPEKIVVAADYKDGAIVTRGWTERQSLSLEEAVRSMERLGVANILTTSVGRDGTGLGPDVEAVARTCESTRMSVLASGGIRDSADLASLESVGASGAVLGRAIYEGTVDMSRLRRES